MPLIICPECATEVSSAAPACIRCGYPLAKAQAHVERPEPAVPVATPDTTPRETAPIVPELSAREGFCTKCNKSSMRLLPVMTKRPGRVVAGGILVGLVVRRLVQGGFSSITAGDLAMLIGFMGVFLLVGSYLIIGGLTRLDTVRCDHCGKQKQLNTSNMSPN